MTCLTGQLSIADELPVAESAQFFVGGLKRPAKFLLAETVVVTTAVILAVKVLSEGPFSQAAWFITPVILVLAALVPVAIRRDEFAGIGFNIEQVRLSVVEVGRTCIAVFPALFCTLWLLKSLKLDFPLRPVLPQGQDWLHWLIYQFMYVAVAEEVFFRGYLQGNILRLTGPAARKWGRLRQWLGVVLSAACFAVAHIILQGRIISALTFLPGIILGWLFMRTRSLLAPILFHALANGCYLLMATLLV
jgi:membrane protease YdiL (CAAX protease family)